MTDEVRTQFTVVYSLFGNQNPDNYRTITVTATSAGHAMIEARDQVRAQMPYGNRLRVDLIRVTAAQQVGA